MKGSNTFGWPYEGSGAVKAWQHALMFSCLSSVTIKLDMLVPRPWDCSCCSYNCSSNPNTLWAGARHYSSGTICSCRGDQYQRALLYPTHHILYLSTLENAGDLFYFLASYPWPFFSHPPPPLLSHTSCSPSPSPVPPLSIDWTKYKHNVLYQAPWLSQKALHKRESFSFTTLFSAGMYCKGRTIKDSLEKLKQFWIRA